MSVEELNALLQLAARAPKSEAEKLWLAALLAKLQAADPAPAEPKA